MIKEDKNLSFYSEMMTSNVIKVILDKLANGKLNTEAIFSDETENFVCPSEPLLGDDVVIKIRVLKNNIDKIYIVNDKEQFEMEKHETTSKFDYYKYTMVNIQKKIEYQFKLIKNDQHYYYSKFGVSENLNKDFDFRVIPNFITPDWAKGTVMYQIYIDRFYNGDKSNDVETNEYTYLGQGSKKIENWNQPLENRDVSNFYGGDLQGIIDKLNYLEDLGVEVLYLNPIFVSPSNHKYDIQDYNYIDPHIGKIVKDEGEILKFGNFKNKYATKYMSRTTDIANLEASNELFIKLVNMAHDKGIKVIIDGVFNHCGAFHKWLDKEKIYENSGYKVGAYSSEDSVYHNYFKWNDTSWPNNNKYDSWWGHDNHPKLNVENSKELETYILDIAKKWVAPPFNVDGWRLDVAADLGSSEQYNHEFWKKFRKSVKEGNKDAIIIAEHYGSPTSWLQGDEWDTVMNYDAFMEPLTWFLTGMQKHSEEFRQDLLNNAIAFEGAMRYNTAKFSIQSLNTSMNQLSNHDHSRFLTRTNMKAGRLHTMGYKEASKNVKPSIMREAVMFQMTWIGAPAVYYGDEAGVTGWTDPDNRRTYPWGNEDKKMIDFHKEMIRIRKENISLKLGSLMFLKNTYGIISYARWFDGNIIVVAINNNFDGLDFKIPVWKVIDNNIDFEELIYSNDFGFSKSNRKIKNIKGFIEVNLERRSCVVLRALNKC